MLDLATLASCTERTSEHAKQAASSAAEIRVLLVRVAEIAQPGEGCPKVLMAVARLVGQSWIDGELHVELAGDDQSTTLTIFADQGFGIREKLVPSARFAVPLDEFSRALELAPKLVLPLKITDEENKIILTPLMTPEDRIKSMAPPAFELDEASRGGGERITAPPPIGAPTPEAAMAAPDDDSGSIDVEIAVPVGEPEPFGTGNLDELEEIGPGDEIPGDDIGPGQEDPARVGPNVHTRPTVRRMVAVDPAAIRRHDPRREEEDA